MLLYIERENAIFSVIEWMLCSLYALALFYYSLQVGNIVIHWVLIIVHHQTQFFMLWYLYWFYGYNLQIMCILLQMFARQFPLFWNRVISLYSQESFSWKLRVCVARALRFWRIGFKIIGYVVCEFFKASDNDKHWIMISRFWWMKTYWKFRVYVALTFPTQ